MSTTSFETNVKQRAFELFLERGGAHGNDQEDWFKAEMELRNKTGAMKPNFQSGGKSNRKQP